MSNYGSAQPDANPELASKFRIEIDNIQVMAFEKVKVPKKEWQKASDRTGLDGLTKQTYSGLQSDLVFTLTKTLRERGADDIKKFYQWLDKGSLDRRDGAIVQLDRSDKEILRYVFKKAWVQSIEPVEGDASSDTGQVQYTIELAVSTYTVE